MLVTIHGAKHERRTSVSADALELPGMGDVPRVRPNYAVVLAEKIGVASQQRSWDVYADVISPAWDELLGNQRDLIGLVCAFIEYITDVPLKPAARTQIARGVRMHGKAFAYGIDRAMTKIDNPDPREWMAYATTIARRTVAERRTRS